MSLWLEPVWLDFTGRRSGQVPDIWHDWLSDRGSLTRRVIDHCVCGKFKVRLLRQGWGRPTTSEAQVLSMRATDLGLVREVELLCDELPLVFARSVIPAASLSGRARQLAQLGDRPLGALLFSDPATKRKLVQMAKLNRRHRIFNTAVRHLSSSPNVLWGRRTLFQFAGKPLLVNEVFLPGLEKRASPGDGISS